MENQKIKVKSNEQNIPRISLRRKPTVTSYYSLLNSSSFDYDFKPQISNRTKCTTKNISKEIKTVIKSEPVNFDEDQILDPKDESLNKTIQKNVFKIPNQGGHSPETYLIDRYKYAVLHIKQGLSVEEACNKYRISKGALLKCLSGGTAPRGKKTRLSESEENEIVEWLINLKDLKYNEAIHLVFEQVAQKFEAAQRPNPFNNGKPSMDWWYDFLSRHPQIMASKPDWIMRGKVNDQYIKDVQSGHLKCTKFRRALLSAIQYIRSLNESISSSENFDTKMNASNFMDKENSTCLINELKNEPFLNDSKPKRLRTLTNKQTEQSSLMNEVQEIKKRLRSNQNLKQNEDFCNDTSNADKNEEDNYDTNIDNATFITEIFNSELELERNDFDNLIDQNLLAENHFKEECDYDTPIYDMNPDHLSLDYMLSNNFRLDDIDSKRSEETQNLLNQFSDSSISSPFEHSNQQRLYQHLLVPDEDEND